MSQRKLVAGHPAQLSATRGRYKVWFNRHIVHAADRNWVRNITSAYTVGELSDISRRHAVTHVILEGEFPPNLNTLFPHLTHLRLKSLCRNANFNSLSLLRKLVVLNISGNRVFTHLFSNTFTSLLSLKELHMEGCELTTLPNSITLLKNLQVLNISGNKLSGGLPDYMFTSLQSLRELTMRDCNLTTLPNSIFHLKNIEFLNVTGNNLSEGLLDDALAPLVSLRELHLRNCGLTTLPNSIQSLQKLRNLDLSENNFTSLPSCVFTLKSLQKLDISRNNYLTSLDPGILDMTELLMLNVQESKNLNSPPQEVCRRGINAVRQYYQDMAKGSGKNLPFVTIAVLGNTMAGKTSLIKTLQNPDRKRILTNRSPEAAKSEITKVFNIEEVEVDGIALRLIDMGGQEVYHITYQLTLRQNCIPVIVVNMQQYEQTSAESTRDEAVRKLAFDYMSHLYLANPVLSAPKLIFTHKDKFENVRFQNLKKCFLEVSNKLCKKILEEEKALEGDFAQIQHFSKSPEGVFPRGNIYEVGIDDEYDIFDLIKKSLLESSHDFVKPLPLVWEEVNQRVMSMQSAYSTIDETLAALQAELGQIEQNQLKTILTYMHDCGKVLWYENIGSLEQYIFHKIKEVTKLLCVFYHHEQDIWQKRIEKFQPYYSEDEICIEKQDFEEFVNYFSETGLMVQSLLLYLIKTETSFSSPTDMRIAVCLLKTFRLLYGPLYEEFKEPCFIIPPFANKYYNSFDSSQKNMHLKVETHFNGLALPQYVYHQMTVGLLELFPDDFAVLHVKRNGANVYQDGIYTQLMHDYKHRKILLYVSSDAANISKMWEKIIVTANNILKNVLETWPASRPVTTSFCAHCLLLGHTCPKKVLRPQWCLRSLKHQPKNVQLCSGFSTTLCNDEEIPSALIYPCGPLSRDEAHSIKEHVNQLKQNSFNDNGKPQQVVKTQMEDDNISECSDVEEEGYADFTKDDLEPFISMVDGMKLRPTNNERVRQLFDDHRQVYAMSDPVRGRVMIINNERFFRDDGSELTEATRDGSYIDYYNISKLFKDMGFIVANEDDPLFDLSKKEILSEVRKETTHRDHKDLGMFILVIMSHGTSGNIFYDRHCKPVNLSEVKDLLSASKFPAMRGKPKLIIFHACSGSRIDMGIDAHTQNSVNFSLPTTASSAPTQHQPLAAENVSPNMAENVSPNMAENVSPNMAENVSPNMAENVSPNMAENVSPNMAENVPPNMAENVSPNMAENVSPNMAENVSPNMAENVSPNMAENVSPNMAENVPPNMAENVPPNMAENVPPNIDFNKTTYLDADDFYVVKPSTESYRAGRNENYGTWFIRILVATFYRHSCHRDIDELFKIIQDRVRRVSIAYCKKTGEPVGGNVPARLECSFTHLRKLFFFPKFHDKVPLK